ncbi:MAG: c-type cytochrome [Gammaproteobacteria bacterium]
MNKWVVFAAIISLSGISTQAWTAGDAATGKEKSATCAGCHGADGNSANPEWPKLAGQHPAYMEKQLKEFKSGARKNPTMSPMAASLSDQDIEDLSAFYAGQNTSAAAADETLVDVGQKIYRGGNPTTGVAACIGCHGPTGMGNPAANFPAISAQHAKYISNQLMEFKAGSRDNDAGKMMQTIAAKMSDAEIKAVASYIQGLH